MATNDFKPFAVGGSAAVVAQATYAAATTLLANGFQAGIADPTYLNKVWRQGSVMAAALGDFIVAETGASVVDDGTTLTIVTQLTSAVSAVANSVIASYSVPLRPYQDASSAAASTLYVDRAVAQVGGYYQDTGSTANAYVVALTPAVAAYDHAVSFRFRTTRPNTGAATINFGAGAVGLKTEAGGALAAGDISTGSIVSVTYDPTLGWAVVNELVPSQLGAAARENIGQGLEDDGAGNLRVKLADSSMRRSTSGVQTNTPVGTVAGTRTIAAADNGAALASTADTTVTLPKASTLWNGFSVSLDARVGVITVAPDAADTIDSGAAGVSYVVPNGTSAKFVSNGATGYTVLFQTVAPAASPAPQYVTVSQTVSSGQYNVDTTAGSVTLTLPANPGVGTSMRFIDPFGTWGQNPVTLTPGGTNTIDGASGNFGLDVPYLDVMLIFKSGDWSFQ